jgi:hypothetical protein
MFYYTRDGRKVDIFNRRPRNMSAGGYVKGNRKILESGNNEEDTILSLLEPNQLVIPRQVVSRIMPYINDITGPIQKNKKKLERVVLQPDEIVIHKSKSKMVEDYLKNKYNLTLPYTETAFF